MTVDTLAYTDYVVLVDEHNNQTGLMEKYEAHRKGLLHRAFSVLIMNSKGEMLLQQRALDKYHSGGLWTNTCCSHPKDGESVMDAAHRRLKEEMGFDCELEERTRFIYKAQLDNDLLEHELDFILTGVFDGTPIPNPNEVNDYKWVSVDELRNDVLVNPRSYTAWFKIILGEYIGHLLPIQ